jgi:dynein heavy chain
MMAIDNSEQSVIIEERVDSLKSYFTHSLYANVCRSLFEKHKLLFSFILTAKLKESEGAISSVQYEFLIATMPGLTNSLGLENQAESWMPNHIWNKFCDLSRLESKFNTMVKNFDKEEQLWKQIYESDNPMQEEFPKLLGGAKFETFAKLCILKVFRPDKLVPAI